MINRLIFETNDALLIAQGYANAALLILVALQSRAHGAEIDDGLHSLELVVNGVQDMVREARSLVEDINEITPADENEPAGSSLPDLIKRYQDAKREWEAQFEADDRLASNSTEWRRYMDLSCAFIDYQCKDMLEVSQRAAFMLTDTNLVDMLASCASEAAVRDFLKSMIPVAPVDNSVDIGEEQAREQP